MRLVDADALDNMLADAQTECKRNGGNFRFGVLSTVRENIKTIPTVDAVPVVHARWSKTRFEKTYAGYTKVSIYYFCSACGKDVEDALFNYCPKCGARMDGERRDEASCMT